MKCLKIKNNCGFYSLDGKEWIEIDKINKEDLLKLLEIAVEDDFEMDSFLPDNIANQAHKIIYKHICSKFCDINKNTKRFKDESASLYCEAIEKYKDSTH